MEFVLLETQKLEFSYVRSTSANPTMTMAQKYINNSLHLGRKYAPLLKTGPLDNAIREFSLA